MNKDIFLIQEQITTIPKILESDEVSKIKAPALLESIKKNGKVGGCVFETKLQDCGKVNKNKRMYKKSTIENGLLEESSQINSGSFFGEMDHPVDSTPARFGQVLISNSCFRLLEYRWDGNDLYGVCETLNNSLGKDMRSLIVENGINVGFSLRALGRTRQNEQGILEVQDPMKVICYDFVANPSHSGARLTSVITEAEQLLPSQYEALCESDNNFNAILESYGTDIYSLIKNENLLVENNQLLIAKVGETTIKKLIPESVSDAFVRVFKKYYTL